MIEETFNKQHSLVIVIPCYNEANQLLALKDEYYAFFAEDKSVLLCFMDDGSSDDTVSVLKHWQQQFPSNMVVIPTERNSGKAATVRRGILHCHSAFQYDYIAYLDADLATSLSECLRVYQYAANHSEILFTFGSRILKIGSVIERRTFRFIVGRIIATVISRTLGLKVYDTQCGCKVIERELAAQLFKEPFISKWLFDVELFFRMIAKYDRQSAISKMMEIPLRKWIDKGDSKVKFGYGFKLWVDLFRIKRKYRHLRTA